MKPILQLALDFVDLPRALAVAEEAVAGGADWLEAGTPLIKSEGLCRPSASCTPAYPDKIIVADMKTMDAGRAEVEYAAKAGAKVVGVLGAASDATIKECVEAAHNYGAEIVVDMVQVADVVTRAKEAEAFGASYIGIHIAIDEQMQGKTPWDTLREVAAPCPSPWPWPAASTPRPRRWPSRPALPSWWSAGPSPRPPTPPTPPAPSRPPSRPGAGGVGVLRARHRPGDPRDAQPRVRGQRLRRPAPQRRHPRHPPAGPRHEAVRPGAHRAHLSRRLVQTGGSHRPGPARRRHRHRRRRRAPAIWGELATNSAIQKQVAGVVIWGGARHRRHHRPGLPAVLLARLPHRRRAQGLRRDRRAHQDQRRRGSPPATGSSATTTASASSPKTRPWSTPTGPWTCWRRRTGCAQEIQAGSTLSQVGYLQKWEKR